MDTVLRGLPGTEKQHEVAKMLATLPMRLGGLGLRSAQRMAHAAYWASWADALPMMSEQLPVVAISIVTALENQDARGCLGELLEAAHRLDREGFVSRPDWRALSCGARPPVASNPDPGEWQHGWQYHASSCSEHQFRETMMLSTACPSDQAHGLVRATFSSEHARSLSSSCSLTSSVLSCWRGCASLCTWLRPGASAGLLWMRSEDTGLHALVQAGSEREPYLQKERWHGSAGKQGRRYGATPSCET